MPGENRIADMFAGAGIPVDGGQSEGAQSAPQQPTLVDCIQQCKPIFDAASADEKIMFIGALMELPPQEAAPQGVPMAPAGMPV